MITFGKPVDVYCCQTLTDCMSSAPAHPLDPGNWYSARSAIKTKDSWGTCWSVDITSRPSMNQTR